MAFDRSKAQLSDDQLDLADAIDQVYETAREELGDGFSWDDLATFPALFGPVSAIVAAIQAQPSSAHIGFLLGGAAAGFVNDNADELTAPDDETT